MKTKISITAMTRGCAATAEQKKLLRECVSHALEAEKVDMPCLINIYTTNDRDIHEVNLEYRGIDRPTDVLSFPMLEMLPGEEYEPEPGDIDPESGLVMLGEMMISLERAAAQAEEYGHSYERELGFLAVHSTLHLLGYDHENGGEEERVMFARQEEILSDIGLVR